MAYDSQLPYSVTVSPGFWKVGEAPRLPRDPARFELDVQRMAASGAFWQLVTAWNEWGEGTSVEPATEFGNTYIDILCRNWPGTADCLSAVGGIAELPDVPRSSDPSYIALAGLAAAAAAAAAGVWYARKRRAAGGRSS